MMWTLGMTTYLSRVLLLLENHPHPISLCLLLLRTLASSARQTSRKTEKEKSQTLLAVNEENEEEKCVLICFACALSSRREWIPFYLVLSNSVCRTDWGRKWVEFQRHNIVFIAPNSGGHAYYRDLAGGDRVLWV